MYGMVNEAIEELVVEEAGFDAWSRVARSAGIEPVPFVSSEAYDDALTYALVEQASRELGVQPDVLLRRFGRHWIHVTGRRGYGALLEAGGASLRDMLEYLPNLHGRVALQLPHLRPPRFVVTAAEERFVRLEYHSEREGLAPFVEGLLYGLGDLFGVAVELDHVGIRADVGHDTFEVRW